MLIKVYITVLKRFRIFSNLFNSQRVGTPIIIEWTGIAVQCSTEKIVLIFLHQRWLGLAVMGKYHSELLMLLNLAFLMKCKYYTYIEYHISHIGVQFEVNNFFWFKVPVKGRRGISANQKGRIAKLFWKDRWTINWSMFK